MDHVSYDIILRNGRIVDGCGTPWFGADIGIKDGKIECIGSLEGASAGKIFDVNNLVVSPGFIDIHDHSDTGIVKDPQAGQKVKQGVTTVMVGNCGSSAAPLTKISKEILKAREGIDAEWTSFGEYLATLEKSKIAINFASLIGHGTIRSGVMGMEGRAPTDSELEEMKKMVAQAMEDGAYGLSTGLIYAPGHHAKTEEIIELAKVTARYGGFYATHIRGHGTRDLNRVREAIEIGEKAQISTQVSHIETHLPDAWGKEAKMLEIVEEARERGLDVMFDILTHMCHTGNNVIELFFQYFQDQPGGFNQFFEQIKNKEFREKIKKEMSETRCKLCSIIVIAPEKMRIYTLGDKTLKQLAEEAGKDSLEYLFDIVLEGVETGKEYSGIITMHDEEDLRLAVKHPISMIVGDGSIGGKEPRDYGIYPMTFRKYVRGETTEDMPEEVGTKLITMEDFIRKSTSLPAQRMELRDRGLVRIGHWADLVVFNPETISDVGSYKDPAHNPIGIKYVFVNGVLVVDKGEHTGALPGTVLRGPGYKSLGI